MSNDTPPPDDRPESLRSPSPPILVDSADCQMCGKRLTGKQTKVCSPKCLTAWHRRQKADAQEKRDRELAERDRELRRLLDEARRLLDPDED